MYSENAIIMTWLYTGGKKVYTGRKRPFVTSLEIADDVVVLPLSLYVRVWVVCDFSSDVARESQSCHARVASVLASKYPPSLPPSPSEG